MLSFSDLIFRYSEFQLEVSAGQLPEKGFFLLKGENGSGKSSLLTAFAGLKPPYRGTIHLEDIEISRLSRRDAATKIAYMPQKIDALPELSVEQFLRQGLYTGGVSQIEQLVHHFDISKLLSKTCDQCSGGQGRLLSLIRACASKKPLILLDEPDAFLSRSRKMLLNALLERFAQEALLIISAHEEQYFPHARTLTIEEKEDSLFILDVSKL